MTAIPPFDAELLRRYDRPGPRYTSYPTAPQFHSGFGEAQFRQAAQLSNDDPIPRRLSLYVHVPFCFSPCFYCGCNRIITRDHTRADTYLQRLVREASMLGPLFDRDRDVMQVHLGGGTPNFLTPGQIDVEDLEFERFAMRQAAFTLLLEVALEGAQIALAVGAIATGVGIAFGFDKRHRDISPGRQACRQNGE